MSGIPSGEQKSQAGHNTWWLNEPIWKFKSNWVIYTWVTVAFSPTSKGQRYGNGMGSLPSRWFKVPFSSLVGGHLTPWKGHLTITKRSLWITRIREFHYWESLESPFDLIRFVETLFSTRFRLRIIEITAVGHSNGVLNHEVPGKAWFENFTKTFVEI